MSEAISRSEAFLIKQKKPLLIVLAAIIVIVGGCLLYHNFVTLPQEEKASTVLAKGQEYFAQGDWQKAISGDGASFPASQAWQSNTAEQKLATWQISTQVSPFTIQVRHKKLLNTSKNTAHRATL